LTACWADGGIGQFTVRKYGDSEFIIDLNHNETSGQTHILASINWLIQHGTFRPARR
jgi:hypothetical protein